MSVRRQAYEWRALVPTANDPPGFVTTGHPILPTTGGIIPSLDIGIEYDIMVGSLGNNIEIPGELKATQFVVVDHISSWPPGSSAQLRILTTEYFSAPDLQSGGGLPARASPFPEPNVENIITNPLLMGGLSPPIYILPGQPWGVIWSMVDNNYQGNDYTVALAVSTTTQDRLIPRCYVKYLLLDGPDSLIAMVLMEEALPVTADNIQWYKRNLIRQRLLADVAGRYDAALETMPQKLG